MENNLAAERAFIIPVSYTHLDVYKRQYMNLSGNAVRFWLQKENIPLENLMIITDDLALPFGTLRMKMKGSDAGHNGLKSIQEQLNTQNYPRLRFGISAEFKEGQQVDYVLGKWNEEEREKLPERIEKF